MMQRIKAKNKFNSKTKIMFSFLKLVMLNFIIRIFIRNLNDEQMKMNFIKMLISSERFFREIYILAEKFKKIKKNFQKFKNKQIKQEKLNFLRNIVQRNMISFQIQVSKTSYHNKIFFYFFRFEKRIHHNQSLIHINMKHFQSESVYQSFFFSKQLQISIFSYQFSFYQSAANSYQSTNHYNSVFCPSYYAFHQQFSKSD